MTVIANPLVNSYKRLISGFEAPGEINWSVKSSNVLIRAVRRREETVIELRSPDPSANPYLLLALCLEAGLWGMEKKILPIITIVILSNNMQIEIDTKTNYLAR